MYIYEVVICLTVESGIECGRAIKMPASAFRGPPEILHHCTQPRQIRAVFFGCPT
jgi:hypothetical protein